MAITIIQESKLTGKLPKSSEEVSREAREWSDVTMFAMAEMYEEAVSKNDEIMIALAEIYEILLEE